MKPNKNYLNIVFVRFKKNPAIPDIYSVPLIASTVKIKEFITTVIFGMFSAKSSIYFAFRAEKAKLIEATKPKDVDLTLPGWGEWGGGGLKPSKKKRKRFTIKVIYRIKR